MQFHSYYVVWFGQIPFMFIYAVFHANLKYAFFFFLITTSAALYLFNH